jgi:DNA-directed RNA polymerase specialized sigma24 family protein
MTPERRRDFEHQWPTIQSGLKGLLARKKVPFGEHDDLIQETALRLYGMWGRVDPGRSPWPLACTIALNLVRDGSRRRPIREVASGDVPDRPDSHEVERAGLARVELGRVRAALDEMSPAYRSALLVEVGDAAARASGSAAQKMTRVRARRKLAQLVEKVSALLPFRYLRFWKWSTDAGQWLIGAKDGVLASIPCIACLAVGVTTVVATGVVAPGAASAESLPRHGEVAGIVSSHGAHYAAAPRLLRREASRGATSPTRVATGRRELSRGAKKTSAPQSSDGSTQSTTPLPTPPEGLPDGGGVPPVPVPNPGGGPDSDNVIQQVRDIVVQRVRIKHVGLPTL